MTTEALRLVFAAKRWKCVQDIGPMAGSGATTCQTDLGQLNLRVAQYLPNQPLIFLRLFFSSADTNANIAEEITKQYGAKYKTVRNRDGGVAEYRWQLSGTVLLTFSFDPYGTSRALDLIDAELETQNNEAANAAAVQRSPTPRF